MSSIVVISDRQILAEGIKSVIAGMGDFALSAVYPSRDFFIAGLHETEAPGLLLLDAALATTLDAIKDLRSVSPRTQIILWVEGLLPEFAQQALQTGVRALLPKTASIEVHADCIRRVANGELWIQKELSAILLSTKKTRLTPREQQLMALLAQGLKNKEIGGQLNITEGTVKVYLSRLFAKVGANDRFDLALLALRNMASDRNYKRDGAESRSFHFPFVSSEVVSVPRTTPLP